MAARCSTPTGSIENRFCRRVVGIESRPMRARCFLVVSALAACGGPTTPKLPDWDKTLPPANVMGTWRGLHPARGIIHLHSPYSHDACDGMPQPGGAPNEPCLDHLRKALCTTQIDYAALTDHDDSMADREWTELFNMRGNDQKVMNAAG